MSKYIARFITYKEYECSCCGRLPVLFYHNDGGRRNDIPEIYSELFDGFELIRNAWRKSIPITSGYRCLKRQKELYDQGVSTAIISVHNFGLALDLNCKNKEEVEGLVKLIKNYCSNFRVGHRAYLYRGQTFCHIDTGYLITPSYSKKLYRGASW